MGNNHLHHIDSLVQYPGSSFQLNVLDVSPPVSVISSYMRHGHFVFITYESVECFYNNSRVYDYSLKHPRNISSYCLSNLDLFISEDTGLVTRLDSVTLEVKDQIKPSKMLPGRVSCMILFNDTLFLGHVGGDVTGISTVDHRIVQEFQSNQISPVESIALSMRYSLLVVGLGSTDGAKARILSLKKRFTIDLLGVKGKVNGLVVFDEKNLVVACDSLNQIVIWDLITGHPLVNALLPDFFPGCINTCMCRTALAPLGFALGFTNNAVAWGFLEYSDDACQYFFKWKGRSKSSTDGNVINLMYSSDVNGLLLSSDRAITLVLRDLDKDVKVIQNKKPLFSLSQHEENIDYSTNIKIFRRNLTNKHPPVNQDMVNRIRERLDGKRGSTDELEQKKKSEEIRNPPESTEDIQKILENAKKLENLESDLLDQSKNSDIKQNSELLDREKGKIIEEVKADQVEELKMMHTRSKDDPIQTFSEINEKSELLGSFHAGIHAIKNPESIENEIPGPLHEHKYFEEVLIEKNYLNESIKSEHNYYDETNDSLKQEKETSETSTTLTQTIVKEPDGSSLPSSYQLVQSNPDPPPNDNLKLDQPEESKLPQPEESKSQDPENSKLVQLKFPSSNQPEESKLPEPEVLNSSETEDLKSLKPEESKLVKPVELNPEKQEIVKLPQAEDSKSLTPTPVNPEPSQPQIKKPQTPFQVFLSFKKPEILKENPSATHKEVVMKVTQLWGQLSESEKLKFSQPS